MKCSPHGGNKLFFSSFLKSVEYLKSIARVGSLSALVFSNSFPNRRLRCITIQMKTKWKFIFMWKVHYTVFIRLNTALDQTSQMHGNKITNKRLPWINALLGVINWEVKVNFTRQKDWKPKLSCATLSYNLSGNREEKCDVPLLRCTISGWQQNQRRRRRQGQRQKIICLYRHTTTFHVNHAILYISVPSLHHYDIKRQMRSQRKFRQHLPN